MTHSILTKEFYEIPTLDLAQKLLGCLLVKESDDGVTSGYIVETEAYKGPIDRAAHSFNYRRTKRTEIMFHTPGHIYTYVMHTHCLVNVVCEEVDQPEAVLIRALEPVEGIELMKQRRSTDNLKNLTNGPGKLTKSMNITMDDYGHKFYDSSLFIAEGFIPEHISSGPRIGIQNSGEAVHYPWRYWVTGNSFVSR